MIDSIDQQLIAALMDDSRLSLKALAGITGLSSPSVGERLRRLEERGVLKNYTVDLATKGGPYGAFAGIANDCAHGLTIVEEKAREGAANFACDSGDDIHGVYACCSNVWIKHKHRPGLTE